MTTDVIEKMARALHEDMQRQSKCVGWYGFYDGDTWVDGRLDLRQCTQAAAKVLLEEMMEPDRTMKEAYRKATPDYGKEGVRWPWRQKAKSRWKAMLRAFAAQHNIEMDTTDE